MVFVSVFICEAPNILLTISRSAAKVSHYEYPNPFTENHIRERSKTRPKTISRLLATLTFYKCKKNSKK